MNFKLKIWRQANPKTPGKLVDYEVRDISPNTSFLEMLDILNETLVKAGKEPIAFDSDCREGICGTCSLTINGEPHGPDHPGAVCELYMRKFRDGTTITVEPFRVGSFPLLKDLVIDRCALDRIVQAGGFISEHAQAPRQRRTRSWFPSMMPIWRWKRRPASDVARAPRRVQMDRPCFSRLRRSRIYRSCHRAIRNEIVVCCEWST